MASMQAVTMTGFGGLDRVEIREVPLPNLQRPNDVRIRIQAAALNRIDLFVIGGLPRAEYAFPHVLGADATGVVESTGSGVTTVREGDRVVVNPGISCGTCDQCRADEGPLCRSYQILGEHREGTMAEYVVVPEANVRSIGSSLSTAQAAALPLATLTAWRMLMTRARVQAGETVLIWGIGGGVSLAALQIAKLAGARVIATSSSAHKREAALHLGADIVLDHTTDDVARRVREETETGADVVVDSVGESTWAHSLKALRPMGRLVTCGATTGPKVSLDIRKLFWFQWSLLGSTMGNHREFREVIRLAEHRHLHPPVDRVYPLGDARMAFERLAVGGQFGKLVIEVRT